MEIKLKILGEFIGHLVMGAVMFVALLAVAGSINLVTHWAAPYIGDESFTYVMSLVERVIIYCDVTFISWWSLYSTYK